MGLFGFGKRSPMDEVLYRFNGKRANPFTLDDATKGVHVFGASGSGKTSGSGKALARAYLNHGMGGLVLTAKPEDVQDWLSYAKETGREEDVILFGPDHLDRFNFLDYEENREGGGKTENIAELFRVVIDMGHRGEKRGGGNPFFDDAAISVVRNATDLIRLAGAALTLPLIRDVMISVPRSPEDVRKIKVQRNKEEIAWAEEKKSTLTVFQLSSMVNRTPENSHLTNELTKYWLETFAVMAPETRTSIEATFDSFVNAFLRGDLYDLFCQETTITPEITFEGKILILDMPTLVYNRLGYYGQAIWKYLWQRAVSRRNFNHGKGGEKPVFLWSDESHQLISEFDSKFLTTCRSGGACVVYLTQNIDTYEDAIGAENRAGIQALLGNFNTKIFHTQSHTATNEYAAQLIGKDIVLRSSHGTNQGTSSNFNTQDSGGGSHGDGSSFGFNSTINEQIDYLVQPREFADLKVGGKRNKYKVEGILYQGGRRWKSTGTGYMHVTFDQRK